MGIDDDVAAKAAAERAAAESRQREAAHAESTAKIADEKARAEFEEWKSSADDRSRTAELTAEGTKFDNLTKWQNVIAAATPDISDVDLGKTSAPEAVLYATLLKTRALASAAGEIVDAVKATNRDKYRVFITSDPDLLTRSALLHGLVSRLVSLRQMVESFVELHSEDRREVVGLVTAATVAAKLIPGLLKLFSANRTLTSSTISVESDQAVTAVAGALASAEGDEFILLDDTRLLAEHSTALDNRDALEKSVIELQEAVASETAKPEADRDSTWLEKAQVIVKAGQDALVALDTIPTGANRSPLATAIAIEELESSDLDFILVVQAAGGDATQLINDRPLVMKDPIYIAATVALSYRLINPQTSQVVSSGVVAGNAAVKGQVGSVVSLEGI